MSTAASSRWRSHPGVLASSGVALGGYDPVTYHRTGEAQRGNECIAWRWNDVDWHFVSSENRSLFQTDPERYAPHLGGYCAKAMSSGFTFTSNPREWHIVDGKLYLFFRCRPKRAWLSELGRGIIARSERNWAKRRIRLGPRGRAEAVPSKPRPANQCLSSISQRPGASRRPGVWAGGTRISLGALPLA